MKLITAVSGLLLTTTAATTFAFTTKQTFQPFGNRSVSLNRINSSSQLNNLFTDIGDMLTGGKLEAETNLPYSPAFCEVNSISDKIRHFAVKERALSFTGEDFDVFDADSGESVCRVRGAMMHLPGKDKMRIRSLNSNNTYNEEVCVLDRVLLSVTPSYDIYRGGMGAEKIAWIEKEVVALTETFDVYLESEPHMGPFKAPPAYKISGDFIERNFCMKNREGRVVAKISQDGFIQFDAFNHYQVQVAPGMDSMLVLACACAIDEEFDEEHKKKREEQASED